MIQHNCPVCKRSIPAERQIADQLICECGWSQSLTSKSSGSLTGVFGILFVTLLMLGGFIHIINWDKYSVAIVPLKLKELHGSASYKDQIKISEICHERKKYDCQSKALEKALEFNFQNEALTKEIISLNYRMENYDQVIRYASMNLGHNEKDHESRIYLAQAYYHLDQVEESKKHYRYLTSGTPNMDKLNAARAYVRLLIGTNDYVTAKNVIKSYRKISAQTNSFLNEELQAAEQGLKKTASRGIASTRGS